MYSNKVDSSTERKGGFRPPCHNNIVRMNTTEVFMIKKVCPVCGKEFIAQKNRQKYCSSACYGLQKRKNMPKQYCTVCKKEIQPNFSTGQKSRKFCSQECYLAYRNDYYKYHPDEFEIYNTVVKVTNGNHIILLDVEDFSKIKKKIVISKKEKDTTAYAYINNTRLHRFIMNCPETKVIDHINHNGLDNRKCNLRIVTVRENTLNRQVPKNNKSGVIGVCYKKQDKVWEAYYCNKYLGRFKKIEDACEARKRYIESLLK